MSVGSIAPSLFSGKTTDNPGDWLRQFENCALYKGLTDEPQCNFFRVLVSGPAAYWLETVHIDVDPVTFTAYKTAFLSRYQMPQITKYKSARYIFSRAQGDEESVDDFICQMQKLRKIVGMTGDMLNYAILNGLKPRIASYVTQTAPTTIDDLLSAARVAELTITPIRDTSLHAKVDKLMDCWEQSNLNAISILQRPSLLLTNRVIMRLTIRLFHRVFSLPIIRIYREYNQSRIPINTLGIPGVRALK